MKDSKKRVALYCRVSTDGQTVTNQVRELEEVAAKNGWQITHRFIDKGISGATGRDKRPAFDQLCKASVRREFDMVAAWSVDRLGRSLQHLVNFLSDLHAKGVNLYLHRQAIDTTTPSGKMMFQFLGMMAEFERSLIAERVRSGQMRAKAQGIQLGRKPLEQSDPEVVQRVRQLRQQGMGMCRIANEVGLSSRSVWRLLQETSKEARQTGQEAA